MMRKPEGPKALRDPSPLPSNLTLTAPFCDKPTNDALSGSETIQLGQRWKGIGPQSDGLWKSGFV